MTPLDYRCKICGKPGVAYYDPACPIHKIEAWRACLCCKRCYKFRDRYQTIKSAIERVCISLLNARQVFREPETIRDAESKIREWLVILTKKLAQHCSDHYRIQNIWDMEMVHILMEKPEGCNKAVNAFRSGYQSQSAQTRELIES